MHAVLHYQTDGLHTQFDQSLKQALRQASTGGREGGREGGRREKGE